MSLQRFEFAMGVSFAHFKEFVGGKVMFIILFDRFRFCSSGVWRGCLVCTLDGFR